MTKAVSIEEARTLLGKTGNQMSDEEIEHLVHDLECLAGSALLDAQEKRRSDALALAELTYDVYKSRDLDV